LGFSGFLIFPKKTSNEKITGLLISQYWKSMVKFCENPQLKSENPDAKGFHHENFITTLLKSRCQKHILWETKKIWELQIWMCFISHGIHVWHILYANIWGILMVNVTIYSIHGSYVKDVSKKQTGFPSHDIFPNMSSVHRQQPCTFLLEFHQCCSHIFPYFPRLSGYD
jgi:hypothetical protein